jgi:hypothetical protein
MEIIKGSFKYIQSSEIVVIMSLGSDDYDRQIKDNKNEIELVWEKELKRRNKKIFNGEILNLAKIEYEEKENRFILQCHKIQYKHYLAQRAGINLGITPLAVSGIVFYQENNSKVFYLGKRSEEVTQYPGYNEFIPSGSIDAKDLVLDQIVNYSKQLIVELKEELNVSEENIKHYKVFCLIFDEIENVYDIGIEVEVLKSKIKTNEDEYNTVLKLPLDLVVEYVKGKNVVNASSRLFEAWNSLRLGGVK